MRLSTRHAGHVAVMCASLSAAACAASAPAEPPGVSEAAWGSPRGVPPLNEEASLEEQAGEAATFERLADEMNEIQTRRADANGGIRRGFHVKPHACVLGELQVLEGRPADTKFGVFASTRTYRAWVRLSNAQSARQDDKTTDIRGLAVKLLDVPGKKILQGEEDATTQDFLSVNSPTLILKDGPSFMEFQKAVVAGGITAAGYFLRNPHVALGLAAATHPVASMFTERYWSASPFKLGPRAMKYSFSPCTQLDRGPGARSQSTAYLRDDAVRTLENEGGCFDLSVQFQRDAAKQPVEDTSVLWKEEEAPFVRVARLVLPKQEMRSAEAQRKEAFCEKLVWTPWHALPEHRPLGNTNRARKVVMRAAQAFRGTPQPPQEPTGAERFDGRPAD